MDFTEWSNDYYYDRSPYIRIIMKLQNLDGSFVDKLYQIIQTKNCSPPESQIINQLLENKVSTKSELIIEAIKSGCTLEKIIKFLSWSDFEKVTSDIFSEGGWETTTNFRYFGEGRPSRDRSRFEVDVMAWKKPFVLIIDNKRHQRSSPTALRKSASKQKNRVYELFEILPIIHALSELRWVKTWDHALLIPMILTWREHPIKDHEKVPIIGSTSLLDVLANFDRYQKDYEWFHLEWSLV